MTFNSSTLVIKAAILIGFFISVSGFCSDKRTHSAPSSGTPQNCPGGICSARGVVDELSTNNLLGMDPLGSQKDKSSIPPSAKENLEIQFGLTPAAPLDKDRFRAHKQKIEAQEKTLKDKLGKEDKENTVLVIGAEEGRHCPRCDAAAKALRDKGYKVVKVPYSQVPHIGSAAWMQSGKSGNPQFPFLAFWGGNDFVYRTYQP